MICNGTGIAPFRSFIQERYLDSKKNNWLFFGGRYKEDSFYYKDEFESYISEGFLKITTAFSKDENCYIQEKLYFNRKDIISFLGDNYYIYLCGSKNMGRDVENVLIEIFKSKFDSNYEKSKKYLDSLKVDKKYLIEVY